MADSGAGTLRPAELAGLFAWRAERAVHSRATYERAKRVLDVAVCLSTLPAALLVLLACAVAVRLESPGPLVEPQWCAGRGGRRFRRYRLRTVQHAAGNDAAFEARPGHHGLAIVREAERTRVGRVLEASGLADLPQLVNVLRGEMSLVGPRPAAHDVAPGRLWHTARLEAKPGVVSAAQVSRLPSLGAEERVRLEIGYIRNATIALDARILLQGAAIAVGRWLDLLRYGAGAALPVAIAGAPATRPAPVPSPPRIAPQPRPAAVPRAHAAQATARPRVPYWTVRGPLLAGADFLAIVGAIALSYYLRFALRLELPGAVVGAATNASHFLLYLQGAGILAGAWQYGLWRGGSYHRGLRGSSAPAARLTAVAASGAYALAALMAIAFLFRDLLLSRQVYAVGAVLAAAAVAGVHAAFGALDRRRAARGDVAGRVVIVGVSASARDFAETLRREAPWMGVVGFLAEHGAADGGGGEAVLGDVRDIAPVHRRLRFDTLVLASPRLSAAAMEGGSEPGMSLLNFCEDQGISLYMLSGSFSVAVSPEEVASFSEMPLIRLKDASLHPLYAFVKRAVDIVVAVAVIVGGLPLWLLLAALVKLGSPGPLFFTQLRAGQGGRPFRMYKFRSMSADAETRLAGLVDLADLPEPVFKLKNDPRVTRLGRWMRHTGMDEIPQLINVLRGEMSIVGPRPEEARLVDRYTPWQRRRLKAKPGITGYQQVKNRGGTSLAERVRLDLVYLKHQSLVLDLYILLKTPAVLIRGSGVTH